MSNLHLSMFLGRECCALPVTHVKEVIQGVIPESIAGMPVYFCGVANYRGEKLPVIDLGAFYGKSPCVSCSEARIVVVDTGGLYGLFGILAERIRDTCRPETGDGMRQLTLSEIIPEDMEAIVKTCQMYEWKELLSTKEESPKKEELLSKLVFRLGNCWFALPVQVISQVGHEQKVHQVPHRSGPGFRGIANVSGDLVLCASLQELLQENIPIEKDEDVGNRRILVIEQKNKSVAFHADEVQGVYKLPWQKKIEGLGLLSASVQWEGKQVYYLQEDSVFTALTRSASHGDG